MTGESGDHTHDQVDVDLSRVRNALDELFLLARQYRSSERFRALLKFVASFKQYSMFNAMLVHMQMPGARYVLPAKRWAREFARLPKPGARPLVMLQPRSPIMFAFDVSETEPIPGRRGRPIPSPILNPFEVSGRMPEDAFPATLAHVRGDGVRVELRPFGSTLGGYVRRATDPAHEIAIAARKSTHPDGARGIGESFPFAEITLNINLPEETNYATLSHELGHLYCGHVGSPDPRIWPDRTTLSRNSEEFEAESVSYLVCTRLGLETPAAEYLHGYLDANSEVPSVSLDAIFKAAHRIEAMSSRVSKIRHPQFARNGN